MSVAAWSGVISPFVMAAHYTCTLLAECITRILEHYRKHLVL